MTVMEKPIMPNDLELAAANVLTSDPLEDLRALADEVARLNIDGVVAYQINMAHIRSHYEELIETADTSDPDTAHAVSLYEEAIRLIDEVRGRLNRRKGELLRGKRR